LVLVPTDKASKNFSFVCQNYYKHVIAQEFAQPNGAYQDRNTTPRAIWTTFVNQAKLMKLPSIVKDNIHQTSRKGDIRLPLMYWLPKMHKDKPKARFIAGSADVFTTPLAKALNSILTFISKELKEKDLQHIIDTGVRRCWFIDRYDSVSSILPLLPRPQNPGNRRLATFDFSTMYTALDLDDHIERVGEAISEAFNGRPQIFCQLGRNKKNDTIRWPDERIRIQNNEHYFTPTDIKNMVQLLVKNTFIKNGARIKQQIRGLPMGTNPAPYLANLHLYRYETKFIDRLMQENITEAQQYLGTFRFIDDVLSVDNPHFEQHVKIAESNDPQDPIYPNYLALNKTTSTITAADFLGMEILDHGYEFEIKVASSKKRFPYPNIKYPSLYGNFPPVLGYGVFTGQLFRFSRICSKFSSFINAAADNARMLLTKGYSKTKLERAMESFLRRGHPYPSANYTMSRSFKIQISG
jgi:hypothetical protein